MLAGFVIGLFVGVFLGVLIIAVVVSAHQADEYDIGERHITIEEETRK